MSNNKTRADLKLKKEKILPRAQASLFTLITNFLDAISNSLVFFPCVEAPKNV